MTVTANSYTFTTGFFCGCGQWVTPRWPHACPNLNIPGTSANGYNCTCGQWVPYGTSHQCPNSMTWTIASGTHTAAPEPSAPESPLAALAHAAAGFLARAAAWLSENKL